MDYDLKELLWISAILIVFGGVGVLIKVWSAAVQVFVALFPIFGKIVVENYLASPYFIVSVIMAIVSGFGIWIGRRGGKVLWVIISLVALFFSAASIGSNLLI